MEAGGGAAEIPEGVSLGLGSVDRGAAVLSFLNLFFLNPVLGAVREERIFKKFWGAKHVGEGVETALQVPLRLLCGVKIGSKALFLKKFKKLFNPKNPGIPRD